MYVYPMYKADWILYSAINSGLVRESFENYMVSW